MTTQHEISLAELRAEIGVKRLSPRALVVVDDGAMIWIATRRSFRAAPLWARRCVAKSDREGRRPDLYSYPETRDEDDDGRHNSRGYTAACGEIRNLSSLGDFPHHLLPEAFFDAIPHAGDIY